MLFSLSFFFLHREIYIGKLKANKAASPPLQNINGGEKLDYHTTSFLLSFFHCYHSR